MTALLGLDRMDGVGLDELDQRAALLVRQDNKYLVPEPALWSLLADLRDSYDVLEIDGERAFGYDSVYFDSAALALHRAHVQGRRLRWKVRTRQYVDSGLTYQEVKLKGLRGQTVKVRQRCEAHDHGRVTPALVALVERSLAEHHQAGLPFTLQPTAGVRYDRTTLVSRTGIERVTVDRHIDATDPSGRPVGHLRRTLALLEVKTERGRGSADLALRARRQHPVQMSKYGCAIALADPGRPHPGLLPVLRKAFVPPAVLPPAIATEAVTAVVQRPAEHLVAPGRLLVPA